MIQWPERFRPGTAPVHVRNEIDVPAPPEKVWAWLVRAPTWPQWYSNAKNIVLEGNGTELTGGTSFRWTTFGVRLRSTVREFAPPSRLAWDARGSGVEAYHAWLLTPTPQGCHVLTEETQYGSLARLSRRLQPHRMEEGHQSWLESLRSKSTGG
jgi:uncharacterized protein YndB with AHSA1/START domain